MYEIFEVETGKVVKTGISGGKVNKNGKSRRAQTQVNKWNKNEGAGKYDSRIVQQFPQGPGARNNALQAEKDNAEKHHETLDRSKHKRPYNLN